MAHIVPTVFAHNKREFMQRLAKLLPVAQHFQVDFMDGRFVRAKSVMAGWLPDMRKYKRTHQTTFEAHLMVRKPWRSLISTTMTIRISRWRTTPAELLPSC